jgi:pimeloyl-ACP methyl ester carboxylesterase
MKKQKMSVSATPETVSGRWILKMLVGLVVLAAMGTWGALCLIFWQGSWQLLYHPTSAVVKTPASLGLQFYSVSFDADGAGEARLKGWWIGAAETADVKRSQWTVLYIHGATGNLGDSVEALKQLHELGVNVFAYDPRGFGQSRFERPSEKRELEDAEAAVNYLTSTRHVDAGKIVVVGRELGGNVALEMAAKHSALAGVVVDEPLEDATGVIFKDERSRMVPAHWLVSDRYDLASAARELKIPVLWIVRGERGSEFNLVGARKMRGWVKSDEDFNNLMVRWLDSL